MIRTILESVIEHVQTCPVRLTALGATHPVRASCSTIVEFRMSIDGLFALVSVGEQGCPRNGVMLLSTAI